jgi:hypothetical protein
MFAALALTSFVPSYPQRLTVPLTGLTMLEDGDAVVEVFSSQPKEKLTLPSLPDNNSSQKFLTLFYNRESASGPNISVLILQDSRKDILYIDKNNDNDLTNDGEPVLFPLSQNSITFDIAEGKDPNQKLRYYLSRKANVSDSIADTEVFKNIVKSNFPEFPDFSLEDKARDYYFACNVTLGKGTMVLEGVSYPAGLFDYSNNGLFNGKDDLLIIDFDGKGLNIFNPEKVFTLDDIIKIGGKNYKIAAADKYGKSITLEETGEAPTHKYADHIAEEMAETMSKMK